MRKVLSNNIKAFRDDSRGTVLIFFAVILLVLLPLIGGGIDISRAVYTKARLIGALDSAGLAGSIRAFMFDPEASEQEVRQAVKKEVNVFFEANFPAHHLDVEVGPLQIAIYSKEVRVSTCARLDTYLLRFIAMEELEVCHGPVFQGISAD